MSEEILSANRDKFLDYIKDNYHDSDFMSWFENHENFDDIFDDYLNEMLADEDMQESFLETLNEADE